MSLRCVRNDLHHLQKKLLVSAMGDGSDLVRFWLLQKEEVRWFWCTDELWLERDFPGAVNAPPTPRRFLG